MPGWLVASCSPSPGNSGPNKHPEIVVFTSLLPSWILPHFLQAVICHAVNSMVPLNAGEPQTCRICPCRPRYPSRCHANGHVFLTKPKWFQPPLFLYLTTRDWPLQISRVVGEICVWQCILGPQHMFWEGTFCHRKSLHTSTKRTCWMFWTPENKWGGLPFFDVHEESLEDFGSEHSHDGRGHSLTHDREFSLRMPPLK